MYENKQEEQTAVLAAIDTGEYDAQRSMEELEELARRCTFYGQRTIGAFQVLGYEDILEIYRLANH